MCPKSPPSPHLLSDYNSYLHFDNFVTCLADRCIVLEFTSPVTERLKSDLLCSSETRGTLSRLHVAALSSHDSRLMPLLPSETCVGLSNPKFFWWLPSLFMRHTLALRASIQQLAVLDRHVLVDTSFALRRSYDYLKSQISVAFTPVIQSLFEDLNFDSTQKDQASAWIMTWQDFSVRIPDL